jgi:hypothetical protein
MVHMETNPPTTSLSRDPNSRKRALSDSNDTEPSGKKQLRMRTPPLPTPNLTPASGEQPAHDELMGSNTQETHPVNPPPPGNQTQKDDEEASTISDLEYARSKLKGRSGDVDPFSTPTPDHANKPTNGTKQKAPDQKTKGKQSRDPLGQPPHPDSQSTKTQPGNQAGTKKQHQKASGSGVDQQKSAPQVGGTTQPGHTLSPALLNQLLPTSEDGVIVLKDFKYTEYPRNRPRLYPQLGYNNLHHHQPQQILAWNSKKGNKVLVCEFRAKYEVDVEARKMLRDNIEETLTGFLGQDTPFELSDPKVSPLAMRSKMDPPWHTLVYNLTDPHFIKLMAHPIIATPKCVLIISPFHQIIPSFIMSITGLTCKSSTAPGKKIAAEAVRQGLLSDTTLANDLDTIAGAGSFQKLIDKLHVFFVNTSPTHPNEGWWNVESLGMPSNISIEQYQAFTARAKKLTFPTEDHGDGSALPRSRECVNCKCISHSVNLCPLYDMKGWLGPPKPTTESRENTQTSSQSARGRGRGRGGNQIRRGYNNQGRGTGRDTAKRG